MEVGAVRGTWSPYVGERNIIFAFGGLPGPKSGTSLGDSEVGQEMDGIIWPFWKAGRRQGPQPNSAL